MNRPYLAGPMRGYPCFNFQAFEDAATTLRRLEYDVVSPHQIDITEGRVVIDATWISGRVVYGDVRLSPTFDPRATILRDVEALCTECDGLILLDGWEESSGALVELAVARFLDLPIYLWTGTSSASSTNWLVPHELPAGRWAIAAGTGAA